MLTFIALFKAPGLIPTLQITPSPPLNFPADPQPIAMHSSLLTLLLLTFALQLSAAPPLPQSHFTKHHLNLRHPTEPPQEYFEVTRPLTFDSLTPSCTLPVFSNVFGNTIGLPPANTTYSPPLNCTWSNAVLHLSAASSGTQYDRIAAVWLSSAEILRTSTPEPTADGIFWNVRKDVTKYSSLLRQPNLTLSVMLENIVDHVFTGVYHLNLTFLYYDVNSSNTTTGGVNFPLSLYPPEQKSNPASLKLNYSEISLDLDKNPADFIIPISAIGDEGLWFRIETVWDVKRTGIQIPLNTYRAVIEVYASFHGNDEFWYSNPPDAYIEMNGLPTRRGHGAYREIFVTLDDNVVGSAIPFPVIFTGGINPLFWEPVVSIGAFNLPSYEMELTPFLGLLLDGKVHYFGLGVSDAISYWLVDANLHLWVDKNVDKVQAKAVKFVNPSSCIERESKFHQLDGLFEVEGETKSEFSGWVNSTAGNLTTHVSTKLEFENTIKFTSNGTVKTVNQEVNVKRGVKIETPTGSLILNSDVERKYPLKITTVTLPGLGKNTNSITTKLDHSFSEEKSSGHFSSSLVNNQKSEGWMLVQDHDVLSGGASTYQRYSVQDSFGCYSRRITATDGSIKNDTQSVLCASPK